MGYIGNNNKMSMCEPSLMEGSFLFIYVIMNEFNY